MKIRALPFLGLCLIAGGVCFSQPLESARSDSTQVQSRGPVRWDVSFRSIEVEGASLIFSHAISGSIDVDIVNMTKDTAGKVGLRLGIEWEGTAGAGGDRNFYHDLNMLFRFTVAGERGRFDLLLGTCSRDRHVWGFGTTSEFAGKLGAEGRLNIISNIVGLFGKLSVSERLTFVGIGLVIGFDTWHR